MRQLAAVRPQAAWLLPAAPTSPTGAIGTSLVALPPGRPRRPGLVRLEPIGAYAQSFFPVCAGSASVKPIPSKSGPANAGDLGRYPGTCSLGQDVVEALRPRPSSVR